MSWSNQSFRFGGGKPFVSSESRDPKLLAFIIAYQRDHGGISPSFPDMMAGCGYSSKSEVHRAMSRLISDGKIRTLPHRARAIEVVGAPYVPVGRPLRSPSPEAQFFVAWKEPGEDMRLIPMEGRPRP